MHPGVWRSGADGARFGLFLPVHRLGQAVTKKIAPGIICPSCRGHSRVMLGGATARIFH